MDTKDDLRAFAKSAGLVSCKRPDLRSKLTMPAIHERGQFFTSPKGGNSLGHLEKLR